MHQVVIDTAKRDDLAALLALYKHLNPDDPPLTAEVGQAIWQRILEAPGTRVIVAKLDKLLVGSCTITVIPNLTRAGRSYALIENVITHPDRRRQGIGRLVLDAAVQCAWDANCYKVMLATGSRRDETLRFYESAGFAKGTKTFFEAKPEQAAGEGPR